MRPDTISGALWPKDATPLRRTVRLMPVRLVAALFGALLLNVGDGCNTPYQPPLPVQKFDVRVTIVGTRKPTLSPRTVFRVSSGQLSVGCGESVATTVRWPLPRGAAEVQTTASWQHTDNLKTNTQQADVEGTEAVAKGTITGRDKEFFNCPGGGHGELVLDGSYQAAPVTSGPEAIKVIHDQVAVGQPLVITLPIDKVITPTAGKVKADATGSAIEATIKFATDTQGKLVISGIEPAGSRVEATLKENTLTVTIGK